MKDKIKALIQQEIQAIAQIPITDNFEQAVQLIYEQTFVQKGKVVCSGMGKAGHIAVNIATTFCSTGTLATYLHPSEAQHGDLGILRENDVLLLVSNSGKTSEILQLLQLSQKIYPKIPIILITGNTTSQLAQQAHIVLYTGGGEEICPLGLTPTTSTTLMTIIGDMLVVLLMEKINFTKKAYSLLHHSGYLGEKSREEVE